MSSLTRGKVGWRWCLHRCVPEFVLVFLEICSCWHSPFNLIEPRWGRGFVWRRRRSLSGILWFIKMRIVVTLTVWNRESFKICWTKLTLQWHRGRRVKWEIGAWSANQARTRVPFLTFYFYQLPPLTHQCPGPTIEVLTIRSFYTSSISYILYLALTVFSPDGHLFQVCVYRVDII